jgi:hypothetical protein
VTRRPGLVHVAGIGAPARLVPFEFNTEQAYLLVFTPGYVDIYMGDAHVAWQSGPWTAAMLPGLAWTQSADTLLLFHPDMPPRRITRSSHTSWTVSDFPLTDIPFNAFVEGVTLTPEGTAGTVRVWASADVFSPAHLNAGLRLRGRPGRIAAVAGPREITLELHGALPDIAGSTDWGEHAFSWVRGWPVCACFHQDRLVLGGSRDLPNRLFLSRTGLFGNFDAGTGLDDEAIEFSLMSDQVNAIRAVFSGRHLQVFTSGAEWMVTGDPLTPSSIQLHRQTRIGSPVGRMVPPVDVDGATVFVARSGRGVHEFAYTEVSAAYQAGDLALVARHLVRTPVSMAYDGAGRLLHVVMADGTLCTLTLYRAEAVTAWTRAETDGAFRAVAEIDGRVYVAVERRGTWRLERFDPEAGLDAALSGTAAAPQDRWTGLGHLEGQTVGVLADGAPRGSATVVGGAVTLDPPAATVQVGLPFRHVIEPLPPALATPGGAASAPLRLVSATFRLLETAALEVDLGRGVQSVPFRRLDTALLDAPPLPFTGDVSLRGLGWRRDALAPLWRIEGATPLPMTLLSVTTDTRMTD